ncbi:MAG: hypothetical protein M1839_003492 [Geoglossum umbratile]|nr:MAG: hypothetical protein M1839_003492 [Geoglossum umbratile]
MSTYTIQAGDTFNAIATKLGTSVQTLENLNPGVNPDDLQIGEVIKVLGATGTYTIVKGDTFNSIAAKFGTSAQTLENLNPGVNPNNLQIGEVINVPGTLGTSQYTIVKGDTFNSIAAKFGTSAQTLENLNPGVNPNNLQIGEVVNVPGTLGTSQYTIVKGDTFNSIASRIGTDVQTLENLNPGVNPDELQIGEVITVPGGPVPGPNPQPNGYVKYEGPASSFPDQSTWADYSSLWAYNSTIIPFVSLYVPEDVTTSANVIGASIPSIAAESGVDARVILCIIMQESGGDVNVQTTPSPGPDSIPNTGIMQAHDGVTFAGADNWPQSINSIVQMIKDGTEGTLQEGAKGGVGLKQLYEQYGNWYEVARAYNSGSVDQSNLSHGLGATDSYVSDVANRLLGHVWPNQ